MIGDVQYQVTDLERRLKVLENKTRSVVPGNAPSRGPDHPLRVATSEGQILPGSDSDHTSRVITSIQAGLSDIESVQDVLIASKTINFGGGSTQTVYATDYIRPDPIVGDIYRMFAGGYFQNTTGGSVTETLQWSLGGGTALGAVSLPIPSTDYAAFWLLGIATVTVAGASGTYILNMRYTYAVQSVAGGQVTNDSIATGSVSANLVAPKSVLVVSGTSASASLTLTLNQYSLERLGASFASKA